MLGKPAEEEAEEEEEEGGDEEEEGKSLKCFVGFDQHLLKRQLLKIAKIAFGASILYHFWYFFEG